MQYYTIIKYLFQHTDDVSMIDDPNKGWGWLVDHGFDIIQTDWTYQCCKYLKDRGINH